ncbi:carbohydrate ABC transporter permease [Kribbella sp. NPDC023972]|uniref:carbohydrate ABC transporter permease n=1 Tax=Kribbella sp. NPDC023972 TaxID=3154795 RepID=UPI0033DAA9D6
MALATRAVPAGRTTWSRRPGGGRIALYAFLVVLAAVFILPMLWALSASFKNRADIFQYPPKLLPSPATLVNYVRLIEEQPFVSWFVTTLIVAVVSTVVAVLVCSLAGFAFAKYRFRGKKTLFDIMFSSLAIPYAVIVLPLFVVLTQTGLTEPFFAMIVPWVAPAFGIFMMRQYIEQTVPDEILEAGRIDGCTEFGIFLRLVLPLMRPALGALAVWNFLNSYNNFLWPLIVVSDPNRYTLALGLATVYGAESHQVDLVLAGSVLAAIPALMVFIVLRKQLLDGLTAGSVKS